MKWQPATSNNLRQEDDHEDQMAQSLSNSSLTNAEENCTTRFCDATHGEASLPSLDHVEANSDDDFQEVSNSFRRSNFIGRTDQPISDFDSSDTEFHPGYLPSQVVETAVETNEESELDTTQSVVKTANVRIRPTNKWICTFQIFGALEMNHCSQMIYEIKEKSVITQVDNYLKECLETYNEKAKIITKKNYKVVEALSGQYIYHTSNKLITGVLIVVGNIMTKNPLLNSHFLVEKFNPHSPILFGEYHNTHFGHAYPIHTKDVVCIAGNSLRSLLENWVDDKFLVNLHWIIPPTSPTMRKISPGEANAKEGEDLQKYKSLIMEMKEELLKHYRETLDEGPGVTSTPARLNRRSKKRSPPQLNTITKYLPLIPGREYSVRSHHWQQIDIPLNVDGSVNDRAFQEMHNIRAKGGIVKKE